MKNIFILLSIFILACNSNEEANSEWLIPSEEVFDGGPGKDGIPSVDNPNFSSIEEIDFLADSDLVVGFILDGKAKAYPHRILDWHEIVNDELNGQQYAITYCPLTGTSTAWDRIVDGTQTTFGVSGKLYNTNLIPYDRKSDSYWSQIRLDCVNGDLIGTKINILAALETTWATWKKAYPNAQVQNTNTGFNRNYTQYPYGDYRSNHDNILFPASNLDNRLPAKERVYILVGELEQKAFSLEEFEAPKVIVENFEGQEVLVIGSKSDNFIVAYENINLDNLTFVANQLPVVAEDDQGNKITLDGRITQGPLTGQQLNASHGFIGYYFAIATFYPSVEIYE